MKKGGFFRKIFGILLIIIGFIGLFLPFIQGILLILAGIALIDERISQNLSVFIKKLKSTKFIILLRYLILLGLIFTLPLIYKIFTPITIKFSLFFLNLFYNTSVYNSILIIDSTTFIEIIPACIAGSAYLLLLILNLSVPMNLKKRFISIFISFLMLFLFNVARIVFLSILYHNNFIFFYITHRFFWYILSTVFVVVIWFFTVKIFSIKEIPVYTDINSIIKEIKE